LACGFVAPRSQNLAGYAPSSRLATGQIGRNERHRIYAHDHLAAARAAGVKELITEDFSHGQDYGGIRAINPFR